MAILHHTFIFAEGRGAADMCPLRHSLHNQHILLYCVYFQNSRDKYYEVNNLKELFETVEIHNKHI